MSAVVLDHTALAALGEGNRHLSGLVVAAHGESGRHVYAPALSVAAAAADRPALAGHIGAMPAIEIADLGFAAALTVGRLVAADVDWRLAHAIDTARPSPEWPQGRPVVTAAPECYATWGVEVIPL